MEKMMAERIYINNGWRFAEQFDEEMTKLCYADGEMQEVRLPHTCRELPFHYFDEHIYQMVCGKVAGKGAASYAGGRCP